MVLIHPTESCNEDDEMDRNNLLEKLTETDRVLLRRTWRCLSRELEKLAVDIFEMIFEQTPEAKLMFPFMKLNYKEDEKKHREFTFHALRFIQVIETTMSHLDSPQCLDVVFENLGKLHAKHEEQLGFQSHYWSVFKECTLFHFRKTLKTSKKDIFLPGKTFSLNDIDCAIILWREVLQCIIGRMTAGLKASGAVRRANRQSISSEEDHRRRSSDSTPSTLTPRSGHSVQSVSQHLRRCNRSAAIPDYFLDDMADDSVNALRVSIDE